MFVFNTIDGDLWADDIKIPKNIVLNLPIDLKVDGKRPDSILNIKKNKQDFQLYNSFQPGLGEYDFWTNKIDKGSVF